MSPPVLLLLLSFSPTLLKCQNSSAIPTLAPISAAAVSPSTSPNNANALPSAASPLQLKIGLLFANGSQQMRSLYGFGQSAPAITLALNRAQTERLIDGVNMTFTWHIVDCDQALAAGYTIQLLLQENVDVIIGPPCLSSAYVTGYIATFYNTPYFLWGPIVATQINNVTMFPTLTDLITTTNLLSMAVQAVLTKFGWNEVSLVYVNDNARMVCDAFQNDFELLINGSPNMTIVYKQIMTGSKASMQAALNELTNRSRIVLTCFDDTNDWRNFLLTVFDLGLANNPEFVFIVAGLRSLGMLVPGSNGAVSYENIWMDSNSQKDGRDNDAKAAARRLIVIDLENQSSAQNDAFNKQVADEFGKAPFYCSGSCMGGAEEQNPSSYAPYLFDATYCFTRSLNRTLTTFGGKGVSARDLARNGSLLNGMSQGSFQGATGSVTLGLFGIRQPTFFVTILDGNDSPTVAMNITIVDNNLFTTNMYASDASLWVNYGGKQPLTKPRCGYTGRDCPQDVTIYIACGGGLIFIFLFAAIAGITFAMLQRRREQERLTRECLIPFAELRNMKDVSSQQDLDKKSEHSKSMRSMHSSNSGNTSKLTIGSNRKLETKAYAHFLYNGEIVFGAKYPVRVRLLAEDFILLRKLRQLDHDNLNKFIGVCSDAPVIYAIWKHCSRGNLKEVIAKEQYIGDTFIMLSLMQDISNGLIALHQSFLVAHGMLTSENCLINDRWQVRISDFGLNMIRESQAIPKKKLLWTAPELLRENNRTGTKEGDVYSFAIICTELLNRETVWNGVERDDEIDEILYRVKRANRALPHRPQLRAREEMNNQQSLIHLIRDCWTESPSDRPKMELVRTMLRQMNESTNKNLMDYVFGMLEQYASSLEQEVEERTKELVEEKRKSDILLYRMLPKQVADKLKLGESVQPEQFQMATIFFSDVVSFTTLAGKCSPLQVVNLLNSLYTTFDNIIDSHDAYKVETIGDGYLVCSGIPKRNGDMHAKEIAELSFDFLRTVSNFRIDHLPSERINLRIGFHTGPAVAGVVGLTMPRYCLFGDTINTASRMESNGKPGHIHISSVSNHYLANLIGGYLTEPRGEVIIKASMGWVVIAAEGGIQGKGVMETFWLLGHTSNAAAAPAPMYNTYLSGEQQEQ